jgi:hypothetical protein
MLPALRKLVFDPLPVRMPPKPGTMNLSQLRDGLPQLDGCLSEFHALDIRAHHQQFLAQRSQVRRTQISGLGASVAEGGIGMALAHGVSAAVEVGR